MAPSAPPTPSQAKPYLSPRKPYPPNAAISEGRPRPVRARAPKRTPMDMTLLQLQHRRSTRDKRGPGDTEVTDAAAEDKTIVRGRVQSAEAQGR